MVLLTLTIISVAGLLLGYLACCCCCPKRRVLIVDRDGYHFMRESGPAAAEAGVAHAEDGAPLETAAAYEVVEKGAAEEEREDVRFFRGLDDPVPLENPFRFEEA